MAWLQWGVRKRQSASADGHDVNLPSGQPPHTVDFKVHMRFVGQPSASGFRQVMLTFPSEAAASLGLQVVWEWWTPVPPLLDQRGWRMVSIRWWHV